MYGRPFTLVETVIAITLFSVIVLAAMGAFLFGIRSSRMMDRETDRFREVARALSRFTESVERASAAWTWNSGSTLLLVGWSDAGPPPGWLDKGSPDVSTLFSPQLLNRYRRLPPPVFRKRGKKDARRGHARKWTLPPVPIRLPPGLVRSRLRITMFRVIRDPAKNTQFVLLEIPIRPSGAIRELATGLAAHRNVFVVNGRTVQISARFRDAPSGVFLRCGALLSGPCEREQSDAVTASPGPTTGRRGRRRPLEIPAGGRRRP